MSELGSLAADLKDFLHDSRLGIAELIAGRKIVTRQQIVLKEDETAELFKTLPDHLKRAMAETEARNKELEEKIAKTDDEGKRRELMRERNQLNVMRKQFEAYSEAKKASEKRQTAMFKLEGVNPLPKFFLKNDQQYLNFWGFKLYQTEEGYLLWYPVLWDDKNKKRMQLTKPASYFTEMFRVAYGIAPQLNSGKFDSNYALDEEGKIILIKNEQRAKSPQEAIDYFENELKLKDGELAKARDTANQYYGELDEEKKKNAHLEKDNTDLQLEVNAYAEKAEAYAKALVKERRRVAPVIDKAVDLAYATQDTVMSQSLAQGMAFTLGRTNEKLQDDLEHVLSQYPRATMREEMAEDIKALRELSEDAIRKVQAGASLGKETVVVKAAPPQQPQGA